MQEDTGKKFYRGKDSEAYRFGDEPLFCLQDKYENDILRRKQEKAIYLGEKHMDRNDWYEAGDQIKKMVQDAVDSRDFSELGNAISDVVNQTVGGLQSVLNDTLNTANGRDWDRDARQGSDGRYQDTGHRGPDWYQKTNREAAERIRRNLQQKKTNTETANASYKKTRRRLKVRGEISGQVLKWTGYSLSGMFGLSLALVGVVGLTTGFSMAVPIGILAVLFGASFAMAAGGRNRLGLARRFRRYHEVLGERTYCLIEELASAIGESCKYVQKDLKKMIRLGYFKEGYLDRKGTLLITDKATYQQYLTTQAEYEHREMMKERQTEPKEQAQKTQQTAEQGLTPECQELIEEGQRYIRHIHECNDRIPGDEMSAKLDRLELVITKIFRVAEKNPAVVSDLKKMMSYYLPTTRKLLDAYCELDEQPISGQNIDTMKKEIEAALDTINTAFEKLLDDLFEEKAWDISSDISVLQTMLAQEGLTGKNDFGRQ